MVTIVNYSDHPHEFAINHGSLEFVFANLDTAMKALTKADNWLFSNSECHWPISKF